MDKDELGFEDRKGELIDALAHVKLSHPAEICILTNLNPTGYRSGQQPEAGYSVYRVVLRTT